VFGPLLESSGRSPQELTRQVEEWIENTMTRISTAGTPENSEIAK
jgi:hypothetical protein